MTPTLLLFTSHISISFKKKQQNVNKPKIRWNIYSFSKGTTYRRYWFNKKENRFFLSFLASISISLEYWNKVFFGKHFKTSWKKHALELCDPHETTSLKQLHLSLSLKMSHLLIVRLLLLLRGLDNLYAANPVWSYLIAYQ